MPRLFDRSVLVRVVRRPPSFVAANPQFFERLDNAIEFGTTNGAGVRVRFSVTKNLGKEPNKATVKISNLSETTRASLEKDVLGVSLFAGFDGAPRLLFTGDAKRVTSAREGTDIVTTMTLGDGMRAYQHARVSRSYKAPIDPLRVLRDAALSMNLTLPAELERDAALRSPLAEGFAAYGPTRDVLTRVLAPYGYGWSMQNGTLQVVKDEQTSPLEEVLVNQAGGMVGQPERTTPDKEGTSPEVKFESLLWPELVPGRRVRLESEFLRLTLKLTDVAHSGDTHGTEMKTSCTGKPL